MVYMSKNKLHNLKRRDVGMLIMGLFVEDIEMYSMRHPEVSILSLTEQILTLDI